MSRQALLIVDMQQGLFSTPRYDADALISRINDLVMRTRAKNFPVFFVQHCSPPGEGLHPSEPGHVLHADLTVERFDRVIKKESCDAFLHTSLAADLAQLGIAELIVTGFATDFCVDTTVRSALAHGYPTIVPQDGHTTSDRPHISAQKVIEHHNFIWANLISPVGAAQLTRCADID